MHPSSSSSRAFFIVHYSPSQFLDVTRPWLLYHERRANIILPHAEKLRLQEDAGSIAPGQFWITAWSSSPRRGASILDFVLSCTEGHLGTYPLFLFSTHDVDTLDEQWLEDRMSTLSQKLLDIVDPARVFSIFGQERAVAVLTRHWSALTGFRIVREPYYEASSTYCTRETFIPSQSTLPEGHVLRPAAMADAEEVARLGQEFAEDSVSTNMLQLRLLSHNSFSRRPLL